MHAQARLGEHITMCPNVSHPCGTPSQPSGTHRGTTRRGGGWAGMLIDKILFGVSVLCLATTVFCAGFRCAEWSEPLPPEPVLAPPCDTSANASDAAAQLRVRIASGVELGECDLQQFDHVAGFIEDWEREFDGRADCESDLTRCEWGWWDAADCRRYQEASRIEDAIDAIYSCAEGGGS